MSETLNNTFKINQKELVGLGFGLKSTRNEGSEAIETYRRGELLAQVSDAEIVIELYTFAGKMKLSVTKNEITEADCIELEAAGKALESIMKRPFARTAYKPSFVVANAYAPDSR